MRICAEVPATGTRVRAGRQGAADLAEIGHGHHGGRRVSQAVTAENAVIADRRGGVLDRISDVFFARPKLLTLLLLLPPLLWIGIVYVGSLFALLLQSFYSLDDYSGLIVREFTLSTYAQLLEEANVQIILRTRDDVGARHASPAPIIAFPIAYYAARYARGWTKALFYLAVMMPLWSSYLVKVYAWKLILAKEGIVTWLANGPASFLAARRASGSAGHRRPVAVVQLYRHVPGLRLHLDPLHDPADPGGARARAGQLHRSLRRSRRRAAADLLDGDLSAGAARHHRRLDLHLLADARRLHRAAPSSATRAS